jgi:hypothetical protein
MVCREAPTPKRRRMREATVAKNGGRFVGTHQDDDACLLHMMANTAFFITSLHLILSSLQLTH